MQVSFNKRTILPLSNDYQDKKTQEQKTGFSTTLFSPVKYSVRAAADGIMPKAQIEAVLKQCAENAQEVEIEFTEGQNQYGRYMEIYSAKPMPKKVAA